jgi:hypothetical protein
LEKPKLFIELYGGLLNRIISTIDADIYTFSHDGKAKSIEDLEVKKPDVVVLNKQEFEHIVNKIIQKQI